MEKLKKLVLRKEVISNLNDPQMKRLRGGGGGTGVLGAWWCEDTQDLKTSCGPSCDNAEYPQEQCPNEYGEGDDTNFVDEGGDCYSQDMEICRPYA